MKKKVLALVCAMTLVFGGAMNVCAAGSVTAGDVQQGMEDVKDELPSGTTNVNVANDGSISLSVLNGASVSVPATSEAAVAAVNASIVTTVAGAAPDVKVSLLSAEDAKTPLAKIAAKIATDTANRTGVNANKKVTKVTTAFVANITASAGGTIALDVAKLNEGSSFKIDTVAWLEGNMNVYALHYTSSGAVERLDCQLKDGAITFKMSSFSPIAIVVEEIVPTGDNGTQGPDPTSAPGPQGPVSPKTADASTAAVVVVIAMMSVAGLVVLKKRVRA